jgi:hypothetical protein
MSGITFGSVGDIISVCLIVKDLVEALDDGNGSPAEYQELIRELWSLERALLQVDMMSRACQATIELNALNQTARQAAHHCRQCIEAFLDKIKKYKRSLGGDGPRNFLIDASRKVMWQLCQNDELVKFRTEINAHSSSINMLLLIGGM